MGQGEVIGIIGLGRMGSAIAQKLAHKNPVQGWNRTARPAPDGVRLADNLGALVQNCTILVTSLFDDPAFDEVSEQLARFDLTGRLVVETSTIAAATLQAAAARLGAAGAALIDAPIAGGPPLVLEARAGMLMGGDAHHVARWQPFAEQLAGRVLHMGPLGAGAAAKTVNNMMLVGYWQVLKEALLTWRWKKCCICSPVARRQAARFARACRSSRERTARSAFRSMAWRKTRGCLLKPRKATGSMCPPCGPRSPVSRRPRRQVLAAMIWRACWPMPMRRFSQSETSVHQWNACATPKRRITTNPACRPCCTCVIRRRAGRWIGRVAAGSGISP